MVLRKNMGYPEGGFYSEIVPEEREVLLRFPGFFEFKEVDLDSDFKFGHPFYTLSRNGHVISISLSILPDLGELPAIFDQLTHLKYLEFDNANITNPDFFTPLIKLRGLRELRIRDSEVIILPPSFTQMRQLTHLSIFCINLRDLPPNFENLDQLIYLYLGCDSFKKFPESLTKLSKLIYLSLTSFKMTEMPESIGNLQSLEYFHLSNSKLQTLPESFGNLESLKKFYIYNCPLECLPESFGKLKNLELFNISYYPSNISKPELSKILDHMISTLPESFGECENLREIDISGIPLRTLPESFGKLRNLRELKIRDTPLIALPESFGQLKNLELLEITRTQLSILPNSFGNFPKLKKLLLFRNQLRSLSPNFHHFPRLESLRISNNCLQRLPDDFWALNEAISEEDRNISPKLNWIDISVDENQLTELPENFGRIRGINHYLLTLSSNPLRSLHFAVDLEKNRRGPCPQIYVEKMQLTTTGTRLINNIPKKEEDFYGNIKLKDEVLVKYCRYPEKSVGHYEYFYLNSKNFESKEVKALYNYYKKSMRELAEQYLDQPESLRKWEIKRLVHEATYEWYIIFSKNLSYSDPVLQQIQSRFEIETENCLKIML